MAILLRLLDDADVFVTNIRPGGAGPPGPRPRLASPPAAPASCTRRCRATALDGPGRRQGRLRHRRVLVACRGGRRARRVPACEPPVLRPGMGDHTAAISLVAAVGAALFDRARTGKGRLVSTSLVRSGAWVVSSDLAAHMAGEHPEPGLKRALYNPLLGCYQAADGGWFWLLGLEATRHWPNVAAAVGREELVADERFDSFVRPHHQPRRADRHPRRGVREATAGRVGRALRRPRRLVGSGPGLRRASPGTRSCTPPAPSGRWRAGAR